MGIDLVPKAYSEARQTSKVDFFAKIVNGWALNAPMNAFSLYSEELFSYWDNRMKKE